MKLRSAATVCLLALWGGGLYAGDDEFVYPPLKQPLRLPPNLVQTLPLNKTASFYGDALRAVDCADNKDLPFGLCGNQLFGGIVMGDSHLSGSITIRFHPPVRNLAHFEVTHGVMSGDDSYIASPQGYELPILFSRVFDAPGKFTEGDLDLTTGRVLNLRYNVVFQNTALLALAGVNPKLNSPVIQFPGTRGHAWAKFEQRPDGLLDYTFRGSTFLPLARDTEGDPVRFPLPFCGPGWQCASVLARGTSLHPHLFLSTREPDGPPCGANCPDIPINTVREFTIFTHSSSFGDDFHLNIPQLGGIANGRSHLMGRLLVQFGPRSGDTVGFVARAHVPGALIAEPPPSPILGPGFAPGLLGFEETLRFPRLSYNLEKVAYVDEPFNFIYGAINLKTGRIIGEQVWPMYIGQSIIEVLFVQNDGRISTDPFFMIAYDPQPGEQPVTYALFENGPNGQLNFRLSAEHRRSFAGYRFPSPDYIKANSFVAGAGSELDIFVRFHASSPSDAPRVRKTGGASNVLSSLNTRFSYNYSIPCDPAGQSFSFDYTNGGTGKQAGTFRMRRLAAVSCTNSPTSRLGPGDYDTISFSGFGTWSGDPSGASPRFATVQVSANPQYPFVGIIVFQDPDPSGNVVLSNVNTKPADKPLP